MSQKSFKNQIQCKEIVNIISCLQNDIHTISIKFEKNKATTIVSSFSALRPHHIILAPCTSRTHFSNGDKLVSTIS